MRLLIVSLCLVAVAVSETYLGFDVTQAMTISQFQCMKSSGLQQFTGRLLMPNSRVDTVGIQNMRNARAGGFDEVHAYVSPCIEACDTISNQIDNAVRTLLQDGVSIGRMWMDMENSNWSSYKTTNQMFVNEMNAAIEKWNYTRGVLTSSNQWDKVVGSDWTDMSSLPLWWANYTMDFTPFAGWKTPEWKYFDNSHICGLQVNISTKTNVTL